jgi:hypothetical protein
MLLCENNALKEKTVHSSMAYYIYVLLYNAAEDDGFLRKIKIRSTISFGGDVKPSAPCGKILRHGKDLLSSTKQILRGQKFTAFLVKFPLLRC